MAVNAEKVLKTDIGIVDLLLSKTKDNSVTVQKVEIIVPVKSFEDNHVPSDLLKELVWEEREPYIFEDCLIVKRK